MRILVFYFVVTLCSCLPAVADDLNLQTDVLTTRATRDPWRIDWTALDVTTLPAAGIVFPDLGQQPAGQQSPPPTHAAAVQHSDAYQTRAKIHKYASYATLPLFAGEIALGQSLFNSSSESGKGLHAAVGAGIIGLFALNTVTGAWNMFGEGWQERDGRTLRLVHGLLMMAADAGFVATWATAPGGRDRASSNFDSDKHTHRAIAIGSIGVGTASYLLMLFANH
jgi:hypothetical protein